MTNTQIHPATTRSDLVNFIRLTDKLCDAASRIDTADGWKARQNARNAQRDAWLALEAFDDAAKAARKMENKA